MPTSRVTRRTFLTSAAAGAAVVGFPLPLRAQPRTLKVGAIHPVTGPLAEVGQLQRTHAQLAAINGTCVGGGLELALACDLRLAARSARFGLPENNLGLIPGIGGCSRLVKLVGFGRAKELVLTGEIITAEDALRHGLVSRVVDDGALMAEALALAERLAGKAPQALGIAKRVLQSCVSADLQTGRTLESFGQSILIKTRDHREGVTAFREKRRPKFEGR